MCVHFSWVNGVGGGIFCVSGVGGGISGCVGVGRGEWGWSLVLV